MYRFFLFVLVSFALNGTEIIPHKENLPISQSCRLAIGCVFQQEGPWLKEWIEFHLLIGVEHFYLYNNLSRDNYLEVLEPYIRSGVVELFDYPATEYHATEQVAVYMDAFQRAKTDAIEWLALIDADEYIVSMEDTTIFPLLDEYSEQGGIYLEWECFGTSGVEELQEGELLIEKLTLKFLDQTSTRWGKTIVQMQFGTFPITEHWFAFVDGKKSPTVPLQKARINHYLVRTEKYLREVKLPRLQRCQEIGRANMFTPESLLAFFATTPYTQDNSMERFIDPLKERMQQQTASIADAPASL